MKNSASLSLAFTFAALAFFSPALLCAQTADDDLLRPMIVRPTDGGGSANAAPAPAPTPVSEIPANDPNAGADTSSSGNLKLPAIKPTQVDLGGAPKAGLVSTSSRDIFANFGPSSGSAVADRVFQLRDEAVGLRQAVDKNAAELEDSRGKGASGAIQFHSTIAAINARLEAGTTKGNPILLRQWSEAEQSLNEVNYSISKLNMLSSSLSSNSAAAAYLLQAVRAAFELSGALDEDHDQLAMIRDEVAKTAVQVDRLRGQVNEDINRQNNYLSNERRNLQTLAVAINRGELIHNSLAAQPVVLGTDMPFGSLPNTGSNPYGFPALGGDPASLLPPPAPAPLAPVMRSPIGKSALPTGKKASPVAGKSVKADSAALTAEAPTLGQLLVLVRFNETNVDYQQPMYDAVSGALDKQPNANFTVVAVTPKSDTPGSDTDNAQRRADNVKNELVQLGLQPSRINMTSVSSEAATSPEVHVYVR